MFVEPMFMVDMRAFRQFTLKLSLERFVEKQRNMCRQAISLLNRSNNKNLFLSFLTCLLLNKKLNLFSASMVFMKVCQVYKQASLERQSIKKRAQQMTNYQKILQNYEANLDYLIVQQQSLGRLKANTNFNANSLNNFLTENAPAGRVLSGEVIIFQNEIQDVFRKLINLSEVTLSDEESRTLFESLPQLLMEGAKPEEFRPLSTKYCLTSIEEYNRCLMEHQIPQSPSQQTMLTQYILKQNDFRLLQSLVQYHVLNDSLELARILIELGSQESKDDPAKQYY